MSEISPVRLFWARLFMTLGFVWLGLCGACTLLFSLGGFSGLSHLLAWLTLCLTIGAVCALPAGLLFLIGRLLRGPRRPKTPLS